MTLNRMNHVVTMHCVYNLNEMTAGIHVFPFSSRRVYILTYLNIYRQSE